MRVLITGARGFIGSALVRRLVASGHTADSVGRDASEGEDASEGASPSPSGWNVSWPAGLRRIDFSGYAAVVHLAAPRAAARSGEVEAASHLAAMECLIEGVLRTNRQCAIVFASSQSATPLALSGYGRGKWLCERALSTSDARHVIVRLGLVVAPGDTHGLYGNLMRIVKRSPCVPVPHDDRLVVQPVRIDDAVQAIETVLFGLDRHDRTVVGVASRPRSLPSLIRDACWEEGLRRVVVPVPLSPSMAMLRVASHICRWLPASHEKLGALLNSTKIDPMECERRLGVMLHEFGWPAPGWSADERLRWEARLLTRWMFGSEPTERMVERYRCAHECLPHIAAGPFADLPELSRSAFVLESIERGVRGPASALSGKFLVLSYLAEVEPRFGDRFANKRSDRWRAWASLVTWGAASLAMILIGHVARRAAMLRKGSS